MLYTLFLFSPILLIDLSVSTEEFEKKPEPLPEETAPIQKLDKLPVVSDSSILPLDIIDKTSDQTVNPTEADHATIQFVSDIDSVLSPSELKGKNPELISDVNEEEKQKEIKDVLPDVMKIYADTVVDEPTPQERKQIVDFTVLEDESKNVTVEKDIETTDKDDESKVIDKENIIPVDENVTNVDEMREKGEVDEKASEKDMVVSDTEDADTHMTMKPNMKVDISSNVTIMPDESIESKPEKNFTSVTVRTGERPLERSVMDLELTEIPTDNERDGLGDEEIEMSENASKEVGLDITLKHSMKGLEKAGLEFDLKTVPSAFETEVSDKEDERLNIDIIPINDYSKTPATSTAALNAKNIEKDKALPQKTRLDIVIDVGKLDKDTEIYEKIDDKVDLNIAPEEVSAPADEQIIHVNEAIDRDGRTVTPMETINIITRMPKLDEAVVPLTTNKNELENKADIRIKSETMDIPEEEIQKRTPKVAPKWLPKVSEKEEPLPDKEMQQIYDEYVDEEQQPEPTELEDRGTSVGIILEDKPFISGMEAPINDNFHVAEEEVMPFKPTSVVIDVVPRDTLDVDQVAKDTDKEFMAILKPQTEKSTLSLETIQMDALPQEKRSYVSKEIDGDLHMDIVPLNEHPHIQEIIHVDLLKNDLAKSDKTEVDIDIIVPQAKKEYEISETLDEKVNINIVPLDEDFHIHEKTDDKLEIELSQKMENIISNQTTIDIDIEFPGLPKQTETHESIDEKVNIGLLPTEEDLDVYETPGEIIEVDISSENKATTDVVSEPFDKETKIEELPDEIEADNFDLPEMDFEISAPAEEQIIFVSEAIDRDGTTLTPMETINIITRMPKLDDAVVPLTTYEGELEHRADKIKSKTMDIPEEEIQKRTPKVAPKWLPKVSEKEEPLPYKEMQQIYDEYVDEDQQPETTELEDSGTSVGMEQDDKPFISGIEAPINDNFHVAEDEVMPFKPRSIEIDVVPRDNLDVDQIAEDTDKELKAILKPQIEKFTLSLETIQMDALPQEKRSYVSKEIVGDLQVDIVPLNKHPHIQEGLREVIHVDLLKNDLAKSDKTEVDIDISVPQAKIEYETSETLDEKVNLNIVPLDEDFHIHEKTDEKIEIELSQKLENIISNQTAIDIDIELPALPKETETHESVDEKVNIGVLPSEEDLDVYETPGELIEVDITSEDEATTDMEPFDKESKIEEIPDEIEADNFDLPEMDFEVSAPAEEQLILVSEAIDREGKTFIPMETLEIIKRMPKKAETVIPVPTYESELVENADIQIRSDTIDNLEEENMKPIPKVSSRSIPNVSDMEENIPADEVQEIYNESVDGEQQPETTELKVQPVGKVPVDKTFTPKMEAPTQDSDLVSEVMPFTPGIIEIDMLPKDRVGVDENAENMNNEIMTIIKEGTVTSSLSLDTTQMDTPLQEKRTSISGEIGENLKMDILPVDDNLNIQERVQESIQIDILQNDTTKSDKTEMDIDIIAPQAKKEYEIREALDEKFNLDIVPVNEDLHVHEKTDAKLEIELSTNMDNVRSDKITTDMQIDFSAVSRETEINESIDEKINIDIPSVDELNNIVHSSGILPMDKTFAPGMEAPKQDKDLVSDAEIMPFTPGIIEIDMLPKDNVGVDEVAENTDKEIMTIFKAGTDISSLSLDNTQMDAPLQDKRISISGEIGESMKMDIIPVDDNLNITERVQEAIQTDILQNATTRSDTTEMDIDIIVPQPKKEYEISETLDEKVNLNIVLLDEDFHIHEKTDEKIEIELSPKMENIISDHTAIDIDIELPTLPKETETHESVDEKVNIGLLPSEEDLDVYETPGEIIEVDISSEDEATTDVVSEPFDKETKIEELPDEIEADNFDLPEMDFEVSAPAEEQLILVSEAIDREGKTLIPMETLEIIKRMPKKAEAVIPVPTYESELVENADIQIRSDTIDNLEEENMKPIPKVASRSIPNVSDMEENITADEVQEIYNESVDGEQQPETTELEVQSVGIVPVDKTFTPKMEAPTQDSDLVSEIMTFTPGIIEIDMLPKDHVGVDENAENKNNEIMTIIKEGTVTSSVSLDTSQMDTPMKEKRTFISGEIGENLKMDTIPVDDCLNIQERVQESIQIDILQNDTTKSDKTEMDFDIIAPQAKKEYEIREALDEKFNLDIVPVDEDLHVHEKTDAKLEIELSTNMDNVRSDKMTTDMQIDFSAVSKETEINESIDEKINIGLLPTDDDLNVYEMPGEIIEVDISSEDDTKSELTETSQVTNKGPAHEVKADEKINIDIPSVDELNNIVHSSGILPMDKTFAPGMEVPKQDKDLVSDAEIMPFTPGIIEIDMFPKDNVGVDEVAENTDKEIMTIFKAGTDISSLSLDNTHMDAPLQDKRTSISGEIGESMKMDIIPVDDNLNITERVQEAIQTDILQNATTRSDTTEMDIDIIVPQPKKEYEISEKLDEKVNLNIIPLDENFHIHEKTDEKIEIELSPKMENIISDKTAIEIDIELPALPKETETHESVDEKVNIGLLPSEEDLDVYETPGEIIEVDISSEDEATTDVVSEPFDKETKIEELPDEIEADNFYLPEMHFEVSAPAEEQLILVSEAIDREGKTLIPMETLEIIKKMPKKAETVIPVPTYESQLVENTDIQIRSDTIDNLEEENMKPIPKVASKSIPNVSDMEENLPAEEVQEIYNESVDGEQQPETTELEVQSVGIVPVDKTFTPKMEAPTQDSDLVSEIMPFTPGIIEIDMLPKDHVGVDENAENKNNEIMTIIKEGTVTSSVSLDTSQMDTPMKEKRTFISGEIGENLKMDTIPVDDNLNIQERVQESIQIDILQNDTTKSDKTEMDIDIIAPQAKKEYEIREALDEKFNLDIVPVDEDLHVHEKTDAKLEIEHSTNMDNVRSDKMTTDMQIDFSAVSKETEINESTDEKINIGLLPTDDDLYVYEMPGEIIEVDISSEDDTKSELTETSQVTNKGPAHEVKADEKINIDIPSVDELNNIVHSSGILPMDKTFAPGMEAPKQDKDLVSDAEIMPFTPGIIEIDMLPKDNVGVDEVAENTDKEIMTIFKAGTDISSLSLDNTQMDAPLQDKRTSISGEIGESMKMDIIPVDDNLNIQERVQEAIQIDILQNATTRSDTTEMDIDIIVPQPKKEYEISETLDEKVNLNIVPLDEDFHIHDKTDEKIEIELSPKMENIISDQTAIDIDIELPTLPKETETHESVDEKVNIGLLPSEEDLDVYETPGEIIEVDISSEDEATTDVVSEPFDKETKIEELPDEIEADNFDLPEMHFEVSAPAEEQLILVSEAIDREGKTLIPMETLEIIKRMPKKAEAVIPVPTYESELVENADIQIRSDTIDNLEEENMKPIPKVASRSIPNVSDMEENITADEVQEIYNESVDGEQQPETTELEVQPVGKVPVDKTFTPKMEAPTQDSDLVSEIMPFTPGIIEIDMLPKDHVGVDENAENKNNEIMTIIKEGTVTSSVSLDTSQMDTPMKEKRTSISGEIGENLKMDTIPVDDNLNIQERVQESIQIDILQNDTTKSDKTEMDIDIIAPQAKKEYEIREALDEKFNLDIVPVNENLHVHEKTDAKLEIELSTNMDNVRSDKMTTDMQIDFSAVSKETEINESIDEKINIGLLPTDDDLDVYEMPGEIIEVDISSEDNTKSELTETSQVTNKGPTHEVKTDEKINIDIPSVDELNNIVHSSGIMPVDKTFAPGMEAPKQDKDLVSEAEIMPFTPGIIEIDMLPKDNVGVDEVAENTDKEIMTILKAGTDISSLSLDKTQMDAPLQDKRTSISGEIGESMKMDIIPVDDNLNIQERVQEAIQIDILQNATTRSDTTEMDIDIIVPQPKKEYEISETLDEKVNLNIVPLDEDFHIHEKTDEKIEIELSPKMENIISDHTAIDIDIELPALPKETETHESVDEKVNIGLLPSEEDLDVYETPGEIIGVDISSEDEATTDAVSEPFDKETKIEELPDEIEVDNFDLPEMHFEVSAPAEEQLILVSEAIDREGKTLIPMETLEIIKRMPKKATTVIPVATYESELVENADIQIRNDTMDNLEEENMKPIPKVASRSIPNVSDVEENIPAEEVQEIYNESVDCEQQPEITKLEVQSVGKVPVDKTFTPEMEAPTQDSDIVSEVMPFTPGIIEIDMLPKDLVGVDENAENTNNEIMTIIKEGTVTSSVSLDTTQMDTPLQEKRTSISGEIGENLKMDIIPVDDNLNIQERVQESIQIDILQNDTTKSDKTEMDFDIIVPQAKKEYEIMEALDEKYNFDIVPENEDLHVHEKTDAKLEIELSTNMDNDRSDKMTTDMQIEFSAVSKETEINESIDEKIIIGLLPTDDDLDVYEMPGEIIEVDISSEDDTESELTETSQVTNKGPAHEVKADEKINIDIPSVDELNNIVHSSGIMPVDKTFAPGMEAPKQDKDLVSEAEIMPFTQGKIEIDMLPKDNVGVDEVAENTDKEIMTIFKAGTDISSLSLDNTQMDAPLQDKRTSISGEIGESMKMDIIPVDDNLNIQERVQEAVHIDILQNATTRSDTTEMDIDIIVPQAKKEYEISETLDEKVNLNIVPLDEDFHIHEKTDEKIELELSPKMENIISDHTAIDIDIELPALPKETEIHESVDEKVNIGLLPSEEDLDVYETPGEIIEVDISSEDEATTDVVSEPFDKETKIEELPDEIEADNFDLPEMDFEVSAPAEEQLILVSEAIDREGKTLIPMETIEIIKSMPKKAETVIPVATYESELVENADIQIRNDTIDNLEEENMKPIPKIASRSIPNVSDMEENIPAEEVQEIYNESVDGEQQPETTELEVQSVGIVPVDKTFTPEMEAPTQDSDLVSEVMPFTPGIIEVDMLPKDRVGVDENAENTNNEIMTIIKEGTLTSSVSLDTSQMDTPTQEKLTSISGEIGENFKMDILPVDDNFNIQERVQESIQIDILQNDTTKSDKTEMDIDINVPQPKKEYEISETLDEKVNLNIVPLDEDFHIHEKTDEKIEIELSQKMENIISDQTAIDIDIELPALPKETETHESVDEKVNIGLLPSEEDLDVYETPGEIIEVDISSEGEATTDVEPFDKRSKIEEIPDEIEADNFYLPEMDFEVSAPAEEQLILVNEAIDREGKTFIPMETLEIIKRMPKKAEAVIPVPTYESELVENADIQIRSDTMDNLEEENMKPIPKVALKSIPNISDMEENIPADEVQEIYNESVDGEQQPETTELEVQSVGIVPVDKIFTPEMEAPTQDSNLVSEVMPFTPGIIEIDMLPKDRVGVDENAENTNNEIMTIIKEGTVTSSLSLDTTQMDTPLQEKRTSISGEIGENFKMDIIPVDDNLNIQERVQESIQIDILQNDTTKSDKTEMDIDINVPQPKKEYEISETLDEKVNLNIVPLDEDFHIHEKTDEKIEIELSQKMENIISDQTAIDIDIELPALPKETETHESVDEKVNIGLLPSEEDLDVYETPGEIIEVDISSEGEATTDVEPFDKESKIEEIPDEIEADNFYLPEMDFEVSAPAEEQLILVSEAIDREGKTLIPMETIEIIKRMPRTAETVIPVPTYESKLVENADIQIRSDTIDNLEEENMKPIPKIASKSIPNVSEMEGNIPADEVQEIYNESGDGKQQPATTELEVQSVGIVPEDTTITPGTEGLTQDSDLVSESEAMPFTPSIIEIDMLPKDRVGVDENAETINNQIISKIKGGTVTSSVSLDTTQMDTLLQEKRTSISGEIGENIKMDIIPLDNNLNIQERVNEAIQIDILQNDTTKSDKTEMEIDITAPQAKQEYDISEALDEKFDLDIFPVDEDLHVHEKTDAKLEIELSTNMDNVSTDKMATDIDIELPALSKDTEISESIDEKFKIDMLPTDEDVDVYEMPGEIIEVDMSSGDETKPELRKSSQDIDSITADEVTEDEAISFDITSKDSDSAAVAVISTNEIDLIPKQQIGDLENVNEDVEIDVRKPLTAFDISGDVDEDVSFDLLPEMNHFEVSAPVEEQIVFMSEAIDSDGKTIIPMETIDITKRMPKMTTETVIPFTTYENELVDSADMQIKSDTMDILEEDQKKRTPKVASKSTPKVSEMEEILPDEEVQPIYDESVDAEQQPVTTELDENVHLSGSLQVDKAFSPRMEAPTQDKDIVSEAEVMSFTPGLIEIDMLPKHKVGVDKVAENTNKETMTIFRDGTDISSLSLNATQMDAPLQEKRTSISGEIGGNIKMDIIPLDDNLNIQEKVIEAIQIDILQNSVADSDKTELDIDIGGKAKKEYGISETLDEKFNLDITPEDEDLHIHEKTDSQIEIELSTNMDNVISNKGATDVEIGFPSLSKETEMNEPIDENVNIGLLPTEKDLDESELPVDFIAMDNSSEDDTKSELIDIDQIIDKTPSHEVIADENINFDMTPVISDIVSTDGSETIVIDSTKKQPVVDLEHTNQDFEIDVRTSLHGLDIPDDVDETVNFDLLPDMDHFDISAPAEKQLIYVTEAIDKDGKTIIPMETIDITKRTPEMAEAVIPLATYDKELKDNADIQIKSDTMDIFEDSKQKRTPKVASKAIPKVNEMEDFIPDKEVQEIYNESVDGENQPEATELEDIVQSAGISQVDKTFASEVDVLKIDEVISEYAQGTLIEDEILVIPREEEIEVLFRDYHIGSESDSDETEESLDSPDESLDSLESIEDDTYNIQYPEGEEVEELRTPIPAKDQAPIPAKDQAPIPTKDQTPFETITVITEEQDETYSETFEIQRTPNIHIEVMSKDTKPSADSELNSTTDKTSRIIPIEEKKADSVCEIIEIDIHEDIHEATDERPKIVPEEKPYEKERIIPIKERIKTDGQEYFIEYPQEPQHDESEPHNVETEIKSEDKPEPELVKEFTREEIDMMKEKLKNDRESHITHDKVPNLISKEDINLAVFPEERSLGTSVVVEEDASVVEKHELEEKEILNLQLKLPVMEEIRSEENALETEEYPLNIPAYEELKDKLSESIPGDSAQIKHTKPNTVNDEQLSAEDLEAPVEVTTQELSSLVQPHEVSYEAFENLEKRKSGTQCLKATGCVEQTHDLTLYESYCYLQLYFTPDMICASHCA